MTRFRPLSVATAVFLLFAAPTAAPAADDQADATQEIWNRHVAAAMAGDIDAVMQDFSEDSVVITTDGVLKGKEAIRGFVEDFLADFTPEVADTIVMNTETAQNNFMLSNFTVGAWDRTVHDTAVIEDGKIMVLATVDYPAN